MFSSGPARRQVLRIVACAVVAAAAAWMVVASVPRRYRAHAGVAVVDQVRDVPSWGREASQRRRALLALVSDLAIAEGIVARFRDNLPHPLRTAEALLACVEADDEAGDLIRISVRTENPALSARLATAWAAAYVEKLNGERVFSGEADVARRLEADLAAARGRLRKAEAAVQACEASSCAVELRARRDRTQALLSRVAQQRAELVRDVWARLHRERMKRAERALCERKPPEPSAEQGGLLLDIRGILAGLGGKPSPDRGKVAPISRPRLVAEAQPPADVASALGAADADLQALTREDAARWEPFCTRMSSEIEVLSTALAAMEAERCELEEVERAASAECEALARELSGVQVAASSQPPLVRLALAAVPPALPEGPQPRPTAAVAAALGAMVALLSRPRRAPEPAPAPRVFDVTPH